jgi:hypothetical protein
MGLATLGHFPTFAGRAALSEASRPSHNHEEAPTRRYPHCRDKDKSRNGKRYPIWHSELIFAKDPGRGFAAWQEGTLATLGGKAGKGLSVPYGGGKMSPWEVSAASFVGNTAKQMYEQGDDGKEQEQVD